MTRSFLAFAFATALLLLVAPAPARRPVKPRPLGGGGFGVSKSKQPKLDAKAKRLLANLGGNIDAAQEQHFQAALKNLATKEPALHEELMAVEPGELPTGEAHTKLVELFWDAAATYFPARQRSVDGGMSAGMNAKISAIAGCAAAAGPAVVDVGCGDGMMVPHLAHAGAEPARYLGLDLSAKMVAAAAAAHPAATFRRADFLALPPEAGAFDCCLLNGASQFFADQHALVAAAAAWVRPGGRIVLAHAQGAAFVRSEHEGNPAVARSCLPTPTELSALADALQLELLPAEVCAPAAPGGTPHTHEGEAFYLVALQKGS